MTRIEATRISGPVRQEGSPSIDQQVASDYLDLLVAARKPISEWMKSHDFPSTPELEGRITSVLDAAEAQVPGISRDSLDRIVRHDPWNYGRWPISMRRTRETWAYVVDFPQLAANWDNDMYKGERKIAEKEYGVGEKEVDFLQAVFEQIPPVVDIHWRFH